jgi:hypothetical protein
MKKLLLAVGVFALMSCQGYKEPGEYLYISLKTIPGAGSIHVIHTDRECKKLSEMDFYKPIKTQDFSISDFSYCTRCVSSESSLKLNDIRNKNEK